MQAEEAVVESRNFVSCSDTLQGAGPAMIQLLGNLTIELHIFSNVVEGLIHQDSSLEVDILQDLDEALHLVGTREGREGFHCRAQVILSAYL
jgi:hypothetical protein